MCFWVALEVSSHSLETFILLSGVVASSSDRNRFDRTRKRSQLHISNNLQGLHSTQQFGQLFILRKAYVSFKDGELTGEDINKGPAIQCETDCVLLGGLSTA